VIIQALKATTSVAFVFLVACGGGGMPVGSVVNSPGGGSTSPPTQLVNVSVTVTVPARNKQKGIRSQYVSVNTESLVIQLAAVNGNGVTGVNPTTIDTLPRVHGCTVNAGATICRGTASGSPGDDVFAVTAYGGTNATGSLLSVGTAQAKIASNGGNLDITNSLPLSLDGVIASLKVSVSPNSAKRGKAAKAAISLLAFDASGAQIVGPSDYATPISLQIQGDTENAFLLHAGRRSGSSLTIVKPTSGMTMTYDGNAQASPVTIAASVDGSGSTGAEANFSLRGKTPPPPVGTIYALNLGTRNGQAATVTEYDAKARGNAAPERTLQLSSKLYARGIAVDPSGNLYVGYFDNALGFSPTNGAPDKGNEIAIYAAGASGSASPSAFITADKTTQTTLFPQFMAFDPTGDLVTYGATSVDGNGGNDAVLIYSSGSTGPAAPSQAWSFGSPALYYSGPTGLALDSSGNFYVNGALHTELGPSYGLFVAPAQDVGEPGISASRTIPWDSTTQLGTQSTTNVSLDSSGEVFIANSVIAGSGSSASCQGRANVFAAGSGGGTTDVPPLRTLTLGTVYTTNAQCDSSTNPLVPYFPSITLYGTTLFVADDFNNAVDEFRSASHGNVQPTLQIAGAATDLSAPIAVVITSNSARVETRPVHSP
jgi:hypothetical protein